jgi:hypothetical protein
MTSFFSHDMKKLIVMLHMWECIPLINNGMIVTFHCTTERGRGRIAGKPTAVLVYPRIAGCTRILLRWRHEISQGTFTAELQMNSSKVT